MDERKSKKNKCENRNRLMYTANMYVLKVLFYGLLSLTCTCIYAQNPGKEVNPDDTTEVAEEVQFIIVETVPSPPEGLLDNLYKMFRYPEEAYDNDIEGQVVVGFVVTYDGSIISEYVLPNGANELLQAEAIRTVRTMPKWSPCSSRGKPTRIRCTLIIEFCILKTVQEGKRVKNTDILVHGMSINKMPWTIIPEKQTSDTQYKKRYVDNDSDSNVYTWDISLDNNPDKYIFVGNKYSAYIIENEKVYYKGYQPVIINSDSFRLLDNGYATDGNIVLYEGKPVDADAPTFRKVRSSEGAGYCHTYFDCFFTDKCRLYKVGQPVEGTNADSKVLGEAHLVNNGKVFYRTDTISGADAESFLSLDYSWGKDKKMVYYGKKQVKDADIATFKAIKDRFGVDKNHIFEYGKILMDIDGSSFRHCHDHLYVDDNYAYIISFGYTYKTPVDGKTFEEVSRGDRKIIYKDKNYTYKYYDIEFKKIEKL